MSGNASSPISCSSPRRAGARWCARASSPMSAPRPRRWSRKPLEPEAEAEPEARDRGRGVRGAGVDVLGALRRSRPPAQAGHPGARGHDGRRAARRIREALPRSGVARSTPCRAAASSSRHTTGESSERAPEVSVPDSRSDASARPPRVRRSRRPGERRRAAGSADRPSRNHRTMIGISSAVLREPTFLILAAVAPSALHGYGIIQSVERLSDRPRAPARGDAVRGARPPRRARARCSSTARRSWPAACAATTGSPTSGSSGCAAGSPRSRPTPPPRAGQLRRAEPGHRMTLEARYRRLAAPVPGGLAPPPRGRARRDAARRRRARPHARPRSPTAPTWCAAALIVRAPSAPHDARASVRVWRCSARARSSWPWPCAPARVGRVPADVARGRRDPGHRRLLHRLQRDRRRLAPRAARRDGLHARHRPAHRAAMLGLSGVMQIGAGVFEVIRYARRGVSGADGRAAAAQRAAASSRAATAASAGGAPCAVVRRGVLLNLLNPKLTLFFFAFLPQFLGSSPHLLDARLIALGGLFMLITFVVFALYAYASAALRERVLGAPAATRRLQRDPRLAAGRVRDQARAGRSLRWRASPTTPRSSPATPASAPR